MNELGRVPLLTPSEELHLGQLVQAMQRVLEARPEGPWDSDERRVIRAGRRAKDRMITANLRLVVALAMKNQSRVTSVMAIEDIIQEGTLGLHRAVEKFDPERGYKFSTYAYWWIRQAIWKVRLAQGPIRIPQHVKDAASKLQAITEDLRLERQPVTAKAILADPRWTFDQAMLERAQFALLVARSTSLDAMLSRDTTGESTALDMLASPDEQDHPELEVLQAAVARIQCEAADDLALVDLRAQGHALREVLDVNQARGGTIYREAIARLQQIAGPEALAALKA